MKQKRLLSYDKLPIDVKQRINVEHPGGIHQLAQRVDLPGNRSMFVFHFETEDTLFMVKVDSPSQMEEDFDGDVFEKSNSYVPSEDEEEDLLD
ncbi:hypothetical protein AAG747_24275 [Rapidithrix thailandica]|uniref:Uncharacterized protein n=1 Tax=Rapidithrix thailandica TaxID=413964 RepID=A0AAW9SGX6_9BACT